MYLFYQIFRRALPFNILMFTCGLQKLVRFSFFPNEGFSDEEVSFVILALINSFETKFSYFKNFPADAARQLLWKLGLLFVGNK